MKTFISVIIATLLIPLTGLANTKLTIDTTLVESINGVGKAPRNSNFIAESGMVTSIKFDNLAYTITPTLHDDKKVHIDIVVDQTNGSKTTRINKALIIVELGMDGMISEGQYDASGKGVIRTLTLQPSLVK